MKILFFSLLRLFFVGGLVAHLLLTVGCARTSDEQQLEMALAGLIEAVEQRSRREVLNYLAKDFNAQQGRGRSDVERMMFYYFRQNQNISVYVLDKGIRINSPRGEVDLKVLVTGSGGLVPERGGRYAVNMLWRKEDGEWRLSRVNWEAWASES